MVAAVVGAFVKDGRGGNLAGVVLDAEKIGDVRRQQIAARLGFSETVFVERLKDGFKLRFFTPTTELDLCGHATIATFGHLFAQRRVSPGRTAIETKAGRLGVEIFNDGLVMMDQNQPIFGRKLSVKEITPVLGGTKVLDARVVSTGLSDLLAEVASRAALLALKPDLAAIAKLTRAARATSLHVFAKGKGPVTAYSRDFAPAVGIDEESATGTASGALACHLRDRGHPAAEMTFIQGESMGKASEIFARLDGGRVRVGGRAKTARLVEI